ncbi:hypothetical protein [uncultured Aquimarina sp.]|uniref:hypothetical protein n=1 Tax=uncultured Aquimarina sp. TaxID=575652 RepID=UPI0026066953|nr:hypothetical protein [uncultured Aquimarina sp.]
MKKVLLLILSTLCLMSCKDDQKEKTIDSKNETESVQNTKDKDSKTNSTGSINSSIKLTSLDLALEVENFITCKKTATERNDCRNSITKTITKAFDLTEFNDSKLGYVIYDSIHPIAERSKNWLQLGTVNQETINQALAHTNRGGLALIIDTAETYGHVVMIVPGESKKSGSWDMKLPNVLSLTNYKPEKSFSNKSLSYAMKKSDDLKIFIRQ